MKIIKALALSVVAGFAGAFGSAIVLGILNIYLSGHRNRIFEKDYNYGLFSGGIDDIILLVISFGAAILTFVIYYRSKSKPPTQPPSSSGF
jgi:hypothetical protein